MQNVRLNELQTRITISGKNINNLRHADDTILMAEHEEELEESEKASLKLTTQETKFMASFPITSWQITREKVKTVIHFIFLCSKITMDGDCHHEIKRCLLLGRKAMTNSDSVLNNRDITLPTKVHMVKAMVF